MKNILVVNVNWVGDVVFSSPVFNALKEFYPQARVACLAVPRVRDVLACVPGIDEVIVYDEKGRDRSLFQKVRLVQRLRRKKFDAVFLLHRSVSRAWLTFCAGIRQRIGYDEKSRGFLLTHKVNPLPGTVHRRDHYLNVIESFGVTVTDRTTVLNVEKDAKQNVKNMLTSHGVSGEDRVIVVNPGGNWDLKRWPPERFALLARRLGEGDRVKIIVSGAVSDRSLADVIRRQILPEKFIDLTGKTDLGQLIALLERADVVVSADSGPLHLASSVGTNVVAVYGPTRPEITGPCGLGKVMILQDDIGCNRRACYYLDCPDNTCMQSVTVQRVFDAVRKIQHS